MNNIIQVCNVKGYISNDTAWLNAEDVARGFGFTTVAKSGNEVVRWARVNEYLKSFGYSPQVGKDDYIPENIVYRLGFKANNEVALKFQGILADEVLPSIRKTGGYIAATQEMTEEEIMARAILIGQKTIERQKAQIAQLQKQSADQQLLIETQKDTLQKAAPKVVFAEAVGKSDDSISIDLMAKLLAQNGVEIGEKRLFKWLRDNLYISDQKKTWNRPYQKWIERGFFRVETSTWKDTSTGNTHISYIPRVTVKGQRHLVSVFCNKTPQLFGNIFEVQSANA